MKTLILFIASLAAVFGQGYKFNPFTGQLDLVGGYTAPSGYSATITAQTTTTVTAATHGQGTAPVSYCFDNATPANAVSCAYTVSSIGDVVFTWSPAFTGTVIIRGPGADAGAAGNVVGPASSTAGAVAFYSGTSGKVLASAGTGLCYDSVNLRVGLGTCSPGQSLTINSANIATNSLVEYKQGGVTYGYSGAGSDNKVRMEAAGVALGLKSNVSYIWFDINGSEKARFAATTGNLLLGTTTDGNYKLDIAASGSSGTLRVYDQTPTTGSTSLVVRAGAGQSGSLVSLQNNAGTEMVTIGAAGNVNALSYNGYYTTTGGSRFMSLYGDSGPNGYIYLSSDTRLQWTSATALGGSVDSGLSRSSAGVLEINNGTPGTLRDLLVRQYKNTPVAVASLQTCNAGNKGSTASVNDALAPAWGATVANGGAAYALVTCNGTNWTVAGI